MKEIIKYPNGFTLVYESSNQELPIAALYAYIRVGSINENDANRGASHFIEHMCFKGTRKIKKPNDLFTEYNKIGAVYNAFTEKDHTCFYLHCADEYIQNCLNILSDIILNSVFKEKEYRMETPVVLEEMIREQDDPDTNLFNQVDSFLYEGTPYSEPVDDISYHRKKHPYDYQQTIDYYRRYYRPDNIVLSIVSSLSFNKIKQVLKNTFFVGSCKTKSILEKREPMPTEIIHRGNNITYKLLQKTGMKSQHLCISFRTCSYSHEDRFSLNLLSQIIGGGMGSRLFNLLRERNGLTYESSCSTDYLLVGGEFNIYAVLDPSKLLYNGKKKGVLPLIIELLNELIHVGIETKELEIAKSNYKGKMVLQQEKISHIASYNGLHALLYSDEPEIVYSEIYEKCYDKITLKQVNEVVRKYFTQPSNICVGIIGEHGSHFPNLEMVKRICDKLIK